MYVFYVDLYRGSKVIKSTNTLSGLFELFDELIKEYDNDNLEMLTLVISDGKFQKYIECTENISMYLDELKNAYDKDY